MTDLIKKPAFMFANVCPECQIGKVFNGFFFINKHCPHCGMRFEKEEGYFFGPMIIAYIIIAMIAVPILIYLVFVSEANFTGAMLAIGAVATIIGPILYRYCKLGWLHLESKFAIKMKIEQDRAQRILDERQKKQSST